MNVLTVAQLGAAGAHLPQGVLAGVRPEDIVFADTGLPGRVTEVEYFGADSIFSVDVGGSQIAVRLQGRPAIGPGAAVHLGWQADALHLFDATTGLRRDAAAAHPSRNPLPTA
jgi:sn-glycerol 3-phosphate transport system ATP-binding protein